MITKQIQEIATSTGKDVLTTFGDFLDYSLWAFGVPVKNWPYKKEDNLKFFDAFRELIMEMKAGIGKQGWCDLFGDTFMELTKGIQKYRGQFFTPDSLCNLMGDLLQNKEPGEKRFCGVFGKRIIVSDPTCGSGRNLLAIKARYADKSEQDQPYFIGEDLDGLCCKMTALNLCIHGCYGEVICHNSLSEPDTLRYGYLINLSLLAEGLPSITYCTHPMMFKLTSQQSVKKD